MLKCHELTAGRHHWAKITVALAAVAIRLSFKQPRTLIPLLKTKPEMPATFTATNAVDTGNEKEWPSNLGMLDWDDTRIVFTKRSLIEFLKYAGVTVDTNFTNISKLPKYAQFGKLSGDAGALNPTATPTKEKTREFASPIRRHTDIFNYDDDDALSTAPPLPVASQVAKEKEKGFDDDDDDNAPANTNAPKPSRRVREAPGGTSSMGNFFDTPETETFKPSRRVRQNPGGQDSISGFF